MALQIRATRTYSHSPTSGNVSAPRATSTARSYGGTVVTNLTTLPFTLPVTFGSPPSPPPSGSTLPPIVTTTPLIPNSGSRTGLRTIAGWETIFNARDEQDHTNVYLGLSTSGDSWDYYNLAFGVDAYTQMWRATGNLSYLDRSLFYIDNVLDDSRPSTAMGSNAEGDQYTGWISQRSDVFQEEVPLFESFFWRYVCELIWYMKLTPAVYNNPVYRTQFDRILTFTEVNMFDKWYNRGAGGGVPHFFRVNTHMTSHWAFISMIVKRLTVNTTRINRAIAFMNDFNSRMRGALIDVASSPPSYTWNMDWADSDTVITNPTDVPHGSGPMSYIMASYGLEPYWTDADIAKFGAQVTELIWHDNGTYAMNIDGSGNGNGIICDGFMKIGRFHPDIQRRVENYTGAKADNYGAVSNHNAAGCLNKRYLDAL